MLKKIMAIIVIFAVVAVVYPYKKLAQTGFQFLSVSQVSRASGMGEAFITICDGADAVFYNPAGMVLMRSRLFEVSVNNLQWIADIKYSSIGMVFSPFERRYGVFGMSIMWVDYGVFYGTMVYPSLDGYIETGTFSPRATSIGVAYSKNLTDRFMVGGQIKYVALNIGRTVIPDAISETGLTAKDFVASVTAFDFGTVFRTGIKSLVFGMNIRNFSKEIKFYREGFQLPLTFTMGVSFDLLDLVDSEKRGNNSLLVAVDAVHPRAYPEYVNLGMELKLFGTFSIRAGYKSNQDEYGTAYGFGLEKFGLKFDYSYTPFKNFDGVQRLTLKFSI